MYKLIPDLQTVGLILLTDLVEEIYDFNSTREDDKNKRVQNSIKRLDAGVNQLRKEDINAIIDRFGEFKIEAFGSSVNGFYLHSDKDNSDLDMSINFYHNPTVNKEDVLKFVLPAIDSISNGNFVLIFDTKVPVIKYTDSVTNEHCDLVVNGVLGVYNSKLIRTYIKCDQRYHKIGYFVKFWTKHWKLVGADNGYFSSYALQLMIIAFLQAGLDVPVLPNLQDFDKKSYQDNIYYLPRGSTDEVLDTNWYFMTNIEEIMEKLNEKHGQNSMNIGELVLNFFNFYLNTFTEAQLISVKHGMFLSKTNKMDNLAFSIIDPFQVEHNPGQSVKSHALSWKTIKSKMQDLVDRVQMGRNVFFD